MAREVGRQQLAGERAEPVGVRARLGVRGQRAPVDPVRDGPAGVPAVERRQGGVHVEEEHVDAGVFAHLGREPRLQPLDLGGGTPSQTASARPSATRRTVCAWLRPVSITMRSAYPSGWAAPDHSRKCGLRASSSRPGPVRPPVLAGRSRVVRRHHVRPGRGDVRSRRQLHWCPGRGGVGRRQRQKAEEVRGLPGQVEGDGARPVVHDDPGREVAGWRLRPAAGGTLDHLVVAEDPVLVLERALDPAPDVARPHRVAVGVADAPAEAEGVGQPVIGRLGREVARSGTGREPPTPPVRRKPTSPLLVIASSRQR